LKLIKIVIDDGDVYVTGVKTRREDGVGLEERTTLRGHDHFWLRQDRRRCVAMQMRTFESDMTELQARKKPRILIVYVDPDAFVANFMPWRRSLRSSRRSARARRRFLKMA
jgi:hypothetical protein